jgi:hypothetical protein
MTAQMHPARSQDHAKDRFRQIAEALGYDEAPVEAEAPPEMQHEEIAPLNRAAHR